MSFCVEVILHRSDYLSACNRQSEHDFEMVRCHHFIAVGIELGTFRLWNLSLFTAPLWNILYKKKIEYYLSPIFFAVQVYLVNIFIIN